MRQASGLVGPSVRPNESNISQGRGNVDDHHVSPSESRRQRQETTTTRRLPLYPLLPHTLVRPPPSLLSTAPSNPRPNTRSDNDQYAHVNNAIYYHLFDAIVNTYLIQHCGLAPARQDSDSNSDSEGDGQIGLVVSSFCEVRCLAPAHVYALDLSLVVADPRRPHSFSPRCRSQTSST